MESKTSKKISKVSPSSSEREESKHESSSVSSKLTEDFEVVYITTDLCFKRNMNFSLIQTENHSIQSMGDREKEYQLKCARIFKNFPFIDPWKVY